MTSEVWVARYPDLSGKVALVTGQGAAFVDVVAALAANGSPICVVAGDRPVVDAALAAAESNGAMGVVSPPGDPATWERVIPHAEQRLGPLDVVVTMGEIADRAAVVAAVLPDMATRRRGVIVEVGDAPTDFEPTAGVRRRHVVVGAATQPTDTAAAVAMCASDVLSAPAASVRLTD